MSDKISYALKLMECIGISLDKLDNGSTVERDYLMEKVDKLKHELIQLS